MAPERCILLKHPGLPGSLVETVKGGGVRVTYTVDSDGPGTDTHVAQTCDAADAAAFGATRPRTATDFWCLPRTDVAVITHGS